MKWIEIFMIAFNTWMHNSSISWGEAWDYAKYIVEGWK